MNDALDELVAVSEEAGLYDESMQAALEADEQGCGHDEPDTCECRHQEPIP